jgi:PAS domain
MTIDDASTLIQDFTIDDLPGSKLKAIYQYWLDVKGDAAMPTRADLNPSRMAKFLSHISLVDVEHDTLRYKFRLIGTESVRAIGFDPTGKYLDEIPLMAGHLGPRYDWLVENKRPYIVSDKLKWSDKSFLDFFSIGLPLSRDGERVDILMYGSLYTLPENAPHSSVLAPFRH